MPPGLDESKYTLTQHLTELRGRLIKSILAIVITSTACLAFSEQILEYSVLPLRNVLQDLSGRDTHRVYTEVYTVEGQEEHILRTLAENSHLRFAAIYRGLAVKMEVVVTFIAILDLLKRGHVRANQSKMYGEIWLEALEVDQETPESNTTPDGRDPAEDQDD